MWNEFKENKRRTINYPNSSFFLFFLLLLNWRVIFVGTSFVRWLMCPTTRCKLPSVLFDDFIQTLLWTHRGRFSFSFHFISFFLNFIFLCCLFKIMTITPNLFFRLVKRQRQCQPHCPPPNKYQAITNEFRHIYRKINMRVEKKQRQHQLLPLHASHTTINGKSLSSSAFWEHMLNWGFRKISTQ